MDEAGLGDECRHRTQRGGASGLSMHRGPNTRSAGDVDVHAFISRPLLDTSVQVMDAEVWKRVSRGGETATFCWHMTVKSAHESGHRSDRRNALGSKGRNRLSHTQTLQRDGVRAGSLRGVRPASVPEPLPGGAWALGHPSPRERVPGTEHPGLSEAGRSPGVGPALALADPSPSSPRAPPPPLAP